MLFESWTGRFGNPGEHLVLRFHAKSLPENVEFFAGLRIQDGKPQGQHARRGRAA